MQKTIEDYIKEILEMGRRAGQSVTAQKSRTAPNSDKTGKLIVSVTHAQNTLPIANAKVEITNSSENLITTQFTDSSGQTPIITLPTVSKDNSEDSDNEEKVADYYTITVTADGYVTTKIVNIPIFEGITTLQPVDMTFLAASDTGDTQTVVLSNADRG